MVSIHQLQSSANLPANGKKGTLNLNLMWKINFREMNRKCKTIQPTFVFFVDKTSIL